MTSPKWYDSTIKADDPKEHPYEEQMKVLKATIEELEPDKYAFQLEQGEETGYLHWQVRVKLKRGISESKIVKVLPGHVTVTSNLGRNFDYVQKDKTCVDKAYRYYSGNPDVIAFRDVIGMKLRQWQMNCWLAIMGESDREIVVVVDTNGCTGKSTFAKWLVYYHNAWEIFPCETSKEMMGQVIPGVEEGKDIFIFDLTRAEGETSSAMWSAVEMIKDGRAYDTRYHDKRVYFPHPKVVVFTNTEPDREMLSRDRWVDMPAWAD